MQVVTAHGWPCPHFPPRVSVKLSEVITPSEGVMSLQVEGHRIINCSGLMVSLSKVKLVSGWGKGYLLLHRSLALQMLFCRKRSCSVKPENTHIMSLCWRLVLLFFLGVQGVSLCRIAGDLETWPSSGQFTWWTRTWLPGPEGNMLGLCATRNGCPCLSSPGDPRPAEKAYEIRPSGGMRTPPIAFTLIALQGGLFLPVKVFLESTPHLEPGYSEHFPVNLSLTFHLQRPTWKRGRNGESQVF